MQTVRIEGELPEMLIHEDFREIRIGEDSPGMRIDDVFAEVHNEVAFPEMGIAQTGGV